MLVIGLTGGTGSGKTEIAKILQKKGGIIVSGDRIGKEVVEKNKPVLKRLVKIFGKQILNNHGKLNRRKLGSLAF
jgi:dephospho-CoA kinase